MKPSTLKQMLKSSKDGLSLTIQCQSGINLPSASMSTNKTRQTSLTGIGKCMKQETDLEHRPLVHHNGVRLSNEFVQSPETPKSTISESSVGYYSLSHSVPSDGSNGIAVMNGPLELVGPDSTTGQRGLNREQTHVSSVSERVKHAKKDLSESACILDSSVPRPRVSTLGDPLPGGLNKCSYRNRPADFYSSRRHNTSSYPSRNGAGNGKRDHLHCLASFVP